MNDLYPVVTNTGAPMILNADGFPVGYVPGGPNIFGFTNLTFGSGTFYWGSTSPWANSVYIAPFAGYGAGVSAIVQMASGIVAPGGSFVGFGVTMAQSQIGYVLAQAMNSSGAAAPAGSYAYFTYVAWTTT